MSGMTVRYKARFGDGKRRRRREKDASSEAVAEPAREKKENPPSRAARQLALAYYIERLIDEGGLGSYAEAARILGVTRARMTQVMHLMSLAPEVQEGILTGRRDYSERRFRAPLRATR